MLQRLNRNLPRRPSPAMVVALIALVVATAGTATAATTIIIKNSRQVATGSINTGDLADGRGVRIADLTPEARAALRVGQNVSQQGVGGPPGPRGEQGPPGAQGEPGIKGDDGADGTALAFAYVRADGTLDTANSKGVKGVSSPAVGVYCFDLERPARNAIASVDTAQDPFAMSVIEPALPITTEGFNHIGNVCAGQVPHTDAVVETASFIHVEAGQFVVDPRHEDRAFWVNFN
jgi:hypothetical protein